MNAFIDLEDNDQVLELVKYTAALLDAEGESFDATCSGLVQDGKVAEVLEQLIKKSNAYYGGEKDVESIFNMISRLLFTQKSVGGLVKDLSAALSAEGVSGHEIVRMKALGNLFNNLPRESPSRFDAYINLLSLAGRAGRISAVTGQFDQIEGWISEWQISKEQVRALYRKIHSVLFAAGKGRQSSIYLVKLLETYNGEPPATLESAKPDARQLVAQSLKDPETYTMEGPTALHAMSVLGEADPERTLLNAFNEGSLDAFQAWQAANPSTLASLGIEEADLTRKVRLRNLQFLCAEQQVVDYATIASKLNIPESDVEIWIIDVIRAGLVEAKIDQCNAKVYVNRASHATFDMGSWTDLKSQLTTWQRNIHQVQRVFNQVQAKILEAGR